MMYGEPALNIEDDQTDRIGIRTLLLSMFWQASRWPLTLAELDGEAPDVPEIPGGLMLIGRQTRRNGGGLKTMWTFEGVNGDGKTVTFKTRGNSPDYQFDPGFSQVSLLLHPKIQQFIDQFDGNVVEGDIIFPPTISSDANVTGLARTDGAGAGQVDKPNPLFGLKDFLRIEGTYTYRYAAIKESEIPDITGKVFGSSGLPGVAPRVKGRNWLCAGTPYQRRGPVLDVKEIYWMSGAGGWPKPLYDGGGASA